MLRHRPLAGEEPQPGELVRMALDGAASVVAGDFLWPNGIAERSGRGLLVSDFARGHVKLVAGSLLAAEAPVAGTRLPPARIAATLGP